MILSFKNLTITLSSRFGLKVLTTILRQSFRMSMCIIALQLFLNESRWMTAVPLNQSTLHISFAQRDSNKTKSFIQSQGVCSCDLQIS